MRSLFPTFQQLTVPAGAGPNDPAMVLGQVVPAELIAYYTGLAYGIAVDQYFQIRRDGDDYWYQAAIDDNSGGWWVATGFVRHGVVSEFSRLGSPVLSSVDASVTYNNNGPALQTYTYDNLAQVVLNDSFLVLTGTSAVGVGSGSAVEAQSGGKLRVLSGGELMLDVGSAFTKDSGNTDALPVYGTASLTTDGSGFITVTHGCPFIPSVVQFQPEAPISGVTVFGQAIVDSIGATTFRVRCLQPAGGSIVTTSVTGRWVAYD